MKKRNDKESRTLPPARLKDHPKQAEMFGNLPDAEFDAFVADMAENGQDTPVEVLPDGTIITGHQRVRAARKLGWKEIAVVVRHDLAAAGPAAVEEHFINDNLLRRQLTPLARRGCMSPADGAEDRRQGVGAERAPAGEAQDRDRQPARDLPRSGEPLPADPGRRRPPSRPRSTAAS